MKNFYTVNEFLDLIKTEPHKWKYYCEVIIGKNGEIYLAHPSHQEKLIEIYCKKEKIDKKEFKRRFSSAPLAINDFICEKYDLIALWYDHIITKNTINRFQKRTIQILQDNKIISYDLARHTATEYSWYLKYSHHYDTIVANL